MGSFRVVLGSPRHSGNKHEKMARGSVAFHASLAWYMYLCTQAVVNSGDFFFTNDESVNLLNSFEAISISHSSQDAANTDIRTRPPKCPDS